MNEEITTPEKYFYFKIHGMPCVNRCRHCYYFGAPGNPQMPVAAACSILDEIAAIREQYAFCMVHFFDEPTIHPDFVQLFLYQAKLGLISEGYFFPTNGCGLARMSDANWLLLKEAGLNNLQFTFFGLNDTHDRFAGRTGAFSDILKSIEKANEFGIEWYANLMLYPEILAHKSDIHETLKHMTHGKGMIGATLGFNYQGRGMNDSLRHQKSDLEKQGISLQSNWNTEKEHRKLILDNKELSDINVGNSLCTLISLEIHPDMNVYYGGGCDYAPLPEFLPYLKLGTLTEKGFASLVDAFVKTPPPALQLMQAITWGELATRYGDPTNEQIFWQQDLVQSKWVTMYLREQLETNRG